MEKKKAAILYFQRLLIAEIICRSFTPSFSHEEVSVWPRGVQGRPSDPRSPLGGLRGRVENSQKGRVARPEGREAAELRVGRKRI